ncbi:NAD(P)-dependent dehydrogenase, short-chain alcohol dehydrogenase family [Seinonella peptonophila]|uniref:NAD(P)-dependent dehydrogenase, short-chain alcohol dehydrogenase family n=1 Tax=Seinonella peptonophila TaxID=112248 RepID=A0A1M5A763_9BACL|nr:SDR family NAD(P)-dependent oxidoreductase [Seinonella peptonophila]SHF26143.1 NAD(P)-dependent dehydrogenase, short-chain alcohol dehydrogenase family [Seinonella peptonophila]
MNHVMITGANRGLGYELLKVFYNAGDFVYAIVRDSQSAERLKDKFGQRVVPVIADIGLDQSEQIVKAALSKVTDRLDILINNAGQSSGKVPKIRDLETEEVAQLFNVHCLGVVRMVKATLDLLHQSTLPRIINISSRLGSMQMMVEQEFAHLKTSYSYQIAKAAQNMLSICLGEELYKKGISVYAVHPGKLKTAGAAIDADIEAEEGAANIYHWLNEMKRPARTQFIQPQVSVLKW